MSLSEFEIISRFFSNIGPKRADVTLGIGDDCALLSPQPDTDIVSSVDTLVQDIHFDSNTPVSSLGYKSVAVSLSDIAAMGAQPAWLMLALTLPAADEQWLQNFSNGVREACEGHAVQLIGGNISRGPLNISTQLTGTVKKGAALRRTGARPGQDIYVTGSIGDAGLGLRLHQRTLFADELEPATRTYLLSRLYKPSARVGIGCELPAIASCCIDISDGLGADLGHLLHASGVGAMVELSQLPVHDGFRVVFDRVGQWHHPISAGEDYELCFTAAPEYAKNIQEIARASGVAITRIGSVESAPGLRFTLQGDPYKYAPTDADKTDGTGDATTQGYRHF